MTTTTFLEKVESLRISCHIRNVLFITINFVGRTRMYLVQTDRSQGIIEYISKRDYTSTRLL